jgi:hypothetical protein
VAAVGSKPSELGARLDVGAVGVDGTKAEGGALGVAAVGALGVAAAGALELGTADGAVLDDGSPKVDGA